MKIEIELLKKTKVEIMLEMKNSISLIKKNSKGSFINKVDHVGNRDSRVEDKGDE